MNVTVPVAALAVMITALVFSLALPIGLCVYFHRKKDAAMFPFFIGCCVFLVFALILERIAHQLVLGSSIGASIQNNILAFAVYGGVMAGLFEETGRFLAFKTVLRKYRDQDQTALMYGSGHGGFEVIVLLGLTMISNLVLAFLLNTGNLSIITDNLSGDQLTAFESSVNMLADVRILDLILSIVERISAVIIHLALSVIVWFSAKENRRTILFALAIILHALVDAATVLLVDYGFSNLTIEIVILAIACFYALVSHSIWKSAHT